MIDETENNPPEGYDPKPPASTEEPAPPVEVDPVEKAAREAVMAARAANPFRRPS